ncbi:MAG: response regulator transcription factor [Flavobacteriales bacterium]|nr:response regulator transcription factor [Flavobacteriales bacterium]
MSHRDSLLLVEGRNSQFKELSSILQKFKLDFKTVNSSAEALVVLGSETPGLVLMDLLIDARDAIDLTGEIRNSVKNCDSNIVVFSDRKENYVEITALNAGADDFMVKPVNKRLFESRLKAWLRQSTRQAIAENGSAPRGDIYLDEERYIAVVRESEVVLQRKEFQIMSLLLSKPQKVFSRVEIKEMVWLDSRRVRNRTIDVHIRNLRSKLGGEYIRTYKGIGYSFEP